MSLRTRAPVGLAVLFAASGALHLVRPEVFTPIVPRALPAARALVYASGAAELACAAGLSRRSTWAGPASAALLLAVWPGNVQMALDATAHRDRHGPGYLIAVWARVPLQLPLIWAALQGRRRP